MSINNSTDWTLMPASGKDIDQVRAYCRSLVRRRAMISAGVSAVPIPGLDVMSDLSLFAMLINDINREFGLMPEQIERLRPEWKLLAYEAAVGMGGMLVGKLVTRRLMLGLLRHSGSKLLVRQAARLVPLAGQLASGAVSFIVCRQLGYQHVEACAAVAQELLAVRPG
jgi:hypothetical protein